MTIKPDLFDEAQELLKYLHGRGLSERVAIAVVGIALAGLAKNPRKTVGELFDTLDKINGIENKYRTNPPLAENRS